MTFEEYFGDWAKVVDKAEFNKIMKWLKTVDITTLCPAPKNIFKIFKLCPFKECRTIFIGQDVYPQKGVATGIPFGNKVSTPISPSLDILKEACINNEIPHGPIIFDQTLESWVTQGVFMINAAMTCEVNKIGSHIDIWRPFISKLISNISNRDNGLVWVLFGSIAQSFETFIQGNHKIIKIPHPAYYARKCEKMPYWVFTEVNNFLEAQYNTKIKFYEEVI